MSEQQCDDRPRGQFFSRVYLERGENLADRARLRNRLAAHFAHYVPYRDGLRDVIARSIKMHLGAEVSIGVSGYVFAEFFEDAEIRDILRVLREGFVDEPPELTEFGEWKCKVILEIRGGRTAGVVTIILHNGKLFVKTVEWEDMS